MDTLPHFIDTNHLYVSIAQNDQIFGISRTLSLFSIEALLKIVAYGLIISPHKPSFKTNISTMGNLWKRKNSLPTTIRGSAIVT